MSHPVLDPYSELHLGLSLLQTVVLDDLLLEYLHSLNKEPNVGLLVLEVLGVAGQCNQIGDSISPFTYWIILRVEGQIVQLN